LFSFLIFLCARCSACCRCAVVHGQTARGVCARADTAR
ncbi:MAG: hypothetical protein RI897_4056, partial [Verrucomicrobiota bacterium]